MATIKHVTLLAAREPEQEFVMNLKCPCDQIFDLYFLHVRVQLVVLIHLAKFQSITNIRSNFILTFNSENLRPPLQNPVPRFGCK